MGNIVIAEKPDSRVLSDGSAKERTYKYTVMGSADQAAVLMALQQGTPTVADSLIRTLITANPVGVDEVADDGIWDAEVKYTAFQLPVYQVGDLVHSFEIGAGHAHTTHARKHISDTVCNAGVLEMFNGAINVEGTGEHTRVGGVEIDIPVYTFGQTMIYSDGQLTAEFIGNVYTLINKVNDAPFKGLAIGECRFLGMSGTKRGVADWECTARFAGSPNVDDVCADWPAAIKPAAAVPKKGWEYFWVRYGLAKGDKSYIQKPQSVHVEQVYDYGDYSLLGLGT